MRRFRNYFAIRNRSVTGRGVGLSGEKSVLPKEMSNSRFLASREMTTLFLLQRPYRGDQTPALARLPSRKWLKYRASAGVWCFDDSAPAPDQGMDNAGAQLPNTLRT
jgi:hypothetical protein